MGRRQTLPRKRGRYDSLKNPVYIHHTGNTELRVLVHINIYINIPIRSDLYLGDQSSGPRASRRCLPTLPQLLRSITIASPIVKPLRGASTTLPPTVTATDTSAVSMEASKTTSSNDGTLSSGGAKPTELAGKSSSVSAGSACVLELTDSNEFRRRKNKARLVELGANAQHLDDGWMTLHEKTAHAERMRRTGGFASMENPVIGGGECPAARLVGTELLTTTDSRASDEHGDDHHHHHHEVYHPPHHSFTEEERALMNQYESLDYDIVNSESYTEYISRRTYWSVKCDWIAKWFIFGLVGVITGTLAALVAQAVEALGGWKFEMATEMLQHGQTSLAYVFFVGVSTAFTTIAALLVVGVEPVAAGSGIPQLKAYLNGTAYMRLLQVKTLVVKLVGVTFSVTGGLIIGKEGPMVHTGGVLGANISHLPGCRRCFGNARWLMRFRNDRDKRDFVSGGTAAGVAAAFGAPVGGVLFALEEAASHWSISLTWMVFFCAMLSTFTLNLIKIAIEPGASFGGLVTFGPPSEHPYKVWETPFFLLCGIVGGMFGAVFNGLNAKINHWRRDNCTQRPVAKLVEVMLIAAATASFHFWLPAWFENCQPIPTQWNSTQQVSALGENPEGFYQKYRCHNKTYNDMATSTFACSDTLIKGFFHNDGYYHMGGLAAYFFVTFILACVTYGISVPSGLFVPCILMGCAYGRLYGEVMKYYVFPDEQIVAGTYALMGAVGMLGGVARMTISMSVILMETTQNMQFLLPIMMILLVGKWIGDLFNISLYDLHVEIQCMPFVEASPPLGMENMVAVQVASGVVRPGSNDAAESHIGENGSVSHVRCVRPKMTVFGLIALLDTTTHGGFPVIGENTQRMVGFILRNRIIVLLNALLKRGEPPAGGGNDPPLCTEADFVVSLNSRRATLPRPRARRDGMVEALRNGPDTILDLAPYIDRDTLTVQAGFPMSKVYTLFRSLGLRHLCVVDTEGRPVGIITRKELMCAFDRDLM